jgi:hypothetical protein
VLISIQGNAPTFEQVLYPAAAKFEFFANSAIILTYSAQFDAIYGQAPTCVDMNLQAGFFANPLET